MRNVNCITVMLIVNLRFFRIKGNSNKTNPPHRANGSAIKATN
jgi:hypothetical protein